MLHLRRVAGSAWALASLVILAAAPPIAGAQPTCGWVNSITHWNASLGWSWSHNAQWSALMTTTSTTTNDVGSGSGSLDGIAGGTVFTGDIEGQLAFDDYIENRSDNYTSFTHTVLSGPLLSFSPGQPPQMILQLDPTACTYTWQMVGPFAAGTLTTETDSENVEDQPSAILPGVHPIPPLPEPLSFSGSAVATTNPQIGAVDPQYVPMGPGAETAGARPSHTFPNASLSWIFDPGGAQLPFNDTCAGARFLLGSEQQDTSFATVDASDPAASCGGGDRSVWFTFFAGASGLAQISTAGSGYGTVVSVWSLQQPCEQLTQEIACGANGASVPVQENTAYRVQVKRSGTAGTGALSIQVTPEPSAAAGCAAALSALAAAARKRRARSSQ